MDELNYPRKWITFVGDRKFEISGGGSKEPTPKLQPQLVRHCLGIRCLKNSIFFC